MPIHKHAARRKASAHGWWLCAWLALACDAVPEQRKNAPPDAGDDASAQDQDAAQHTHLSLTSVWGAAPGDIWAVGTEGSVVHYDGERWQRFEPLTEGNLVSVHGVGPDDVWAVGEDIALHWDGTAWSVVLQGVGETLLGVWQTDANNVWMVGIALGPDLGLVRHWDGEGWTSSQLTGVSSIWDVWNSPDGTLWFGGTAAGGSGFLGHRQDMEFSRASYPGGSLRGIWGGSGVDVWVAPYQGAMQHWDGTSWSEHDFGSDTVRLLSVSGTAPEDVWAVGLNGLIEHWDGDAWRRVQSNTDATLWSVWAAAPDNAWAVGGAILHWDGATWQSVESP